MTTREEDKGYAGSLVIPDGSSASLSIPSVVEALVREYVANVIRIRTRWALGEITGAEATKQVGDEGLRMQDIFLGKDARYEASAWNTKPMLGEFLRTVVGGTAEDSISRTFNGVYIDVSEAMRSDAFGLSSPDMLKVVTDEAIARTIAQMLGAPNDTFVKQE